MVSYSRSDMKIPVRPAPLPPGTNRNANFRHSTTALDDWGDGNDPFPKLTPTSRPLSLHLGRPPGQKKKPPPRPPPPKFAQKNQQRKQVPNRPSNLLSGIFSRNTSRMTNSQHNISTQQKNMKKETQMPIATASLIDLHSPSCSPTPTTRSSSDGLSVNSFGSDGSVSNNGHTPGGGSSSMFESGFEDDFDFFGGLSTSSSFSTPSSEQKDPWSIQPQDPFSPPRQQTTSSSAPTQKVTSNSTFYKQVVSSSTVVKSTSFTSMPTIIRAKPGRPPTLPKVSEATSDQVSRISLFPVAVNRSTAKNHTTNGEYDDNDAGNWSPPMPSIPPPPLPPEALRELDIDGPPPVLPPRPLKFQAEDMKKPYGIALYDYPATHPDDLSFQASDVIFLLHQVNADWLYGQVGQNQGMFPTNFIKIVVPLNGTEGDNSKQLQRSPAQVVTALYSFSPETWDDLELQEGSSVYVISRIDDDWLYGECGGKYGQFPSAYVDHIPSNLPQRSD
ncbi:SH3 domain-containing protein 19-like isoform X2 [Periplaneta americana]|uniref:SH3 domain-containing protein 19-like isoform X2 n=1 Tax=Periplaneta americana TaxID=6978 RepID=UPI0037E96620